MPLRLLALLLLLPSLAAAKPKIHIAFQWHMHQPIYWPYETVVQTANAGRWGFDVVSIHNDRGGPYTAWPIDAVDAGKSLEHLGAQVSFTGSLMENLDALEAAGRGFGGWKNRWKGSRSLGTSLGNPRLDLVIISYHHPLLPLIPAADRRLQIAMHRKALERSFGAPSKPARGMFPPETAFAEHIIPELVAEGVQWAFVDNIHFDRARPDYPWVSGSNLFPPNPAEQRNTSGSATWVQLKNLWAPSKVSAPWGYQPHWVSYRDPATGQESRIIAVPAARYEGNEDARGGYGAFLYEQVMSQYEAQNTDDKHPMLITLHHDGDNYGGGTDSYYHGNFGAFLSWVQSQGSRFEATTVQDYLDRFPPDASDVIHVEPGSWSGADNGDPEFAKWNGKPGADGYSPDRNSWAVIVAAANRVHTAQAIRPYGSLDAIIAGTGTATEKAWHFLLNAETSCYWYWDGSEGGKWDSHPARGANLAVDQADMVIAGGQDTTPPTLFLPQRSPYNPGGREWGTTVQPSDFDVWTYAYDVSGLKDVTLHHRVQKGGQVAQPNEMYAGKWTDTAMAKQALPASKTDPAPRYRGEEYRAKIAGVTDALVDYYVSATDGKGQVARTPIQHVVVGTNSGPGPMYDLSSTAKDLAAGGDLSGGAVDMAVPEGDAAVPPVGAPGWSPESPTTGDRILVWDVHPGRLHWGTNGWQAPPMSVWPDGTVAFDAKSVETPLAGPDAEGRYSVEVGPFAGSGVTVIDLVYHRDDGTWDNNGGEDYHIALSDGPATPPDMTRPRDLRRKADGGTTGDGGGCSCRSGGRGAGDLGLPVVALALLLIRRRR